MKKLIDNLFLKKSHYSWRAFFSFVTLVTLSTVLLCNGLVESDQWVDVVEWVTGFFIVGETARKFMSGEKSAAPVEPKIENL